jgi:hypothetical protein
MLRVGETGTNKQQQTYMSSIVISGFRCGVNDVFALLGCYVA